MATMNARELLEREIESLPEPLAAEVFDFVMFVKDRHAEEEFLWQQAEAAETYRREHPDKVMTASANEWDAASQTKTKD
jgi:hypothetical protein